MKQSSILTRRGVLAIAVTLLITAVTLVAQDAPVTSSTLIIQPGTILTVRVNEEISSNLNQPGDVFSATLAQPVVVRGIVVAQRGQTVAGRVVEAKKAGMVSGVSRLGITLTALTLVDGQNVPIRSQLLARKGPTSTDRDAAAVAGTTGMGAAIGAAADWGEGAAIGAGAGAVASTIGVLLTRGHSTVVYPEMLLTFQITQPAIIYTDDAPQAFRSVVPGDYAQANTQPEQAAAPPAPPAPPPPAYPPPYRLYYGPPSYPYAYYYPYYDYYPYYAYPYYYGPSFSFFFGNPGYYSYPRYYGYPRFYGYRSYGYPRIHGYRPYYGHGYIPRAAPHHGGVTPPRSHAGGRPHR